LFSTAVGACTTGAITQPASALARPPLRVRDPVDPMVADECSRRGLIADELRGVTPPPYMA
jgi:hypothetical protein